MATIGPKLQKEDLKIMWNQLILLLSADHKGKIQHPASDNDQYQIFTERIEEEGNHGVILLFVCFPSIWQFVAWINSELAAGSIGIVVPTSPWWTFLS